jgi:hypothetical protein
MQAARVEAIRGAPRAEARPSIQRGEVILSNAPTRAAIVLPVVGGLSEKFASAFRDALPGLSLSVLPPFPGRPYNGELRDIEVLFTFGQFLTDEAGARGHSGAIRPESHHSIPASDLWTGRGATGPGNVDRQLLTVNDRNVRRDWWQLARGYRVRSRALRELGPPPGSPEANPC